MIRYIEHKKKVLEAKKDKKNNLMIIVERYSDFEIILNYTKTPFSQFKDFSFEMKALI